MPFSTITSGRLPRPLATAVNRILQIDKLEQLYQTTRSGGEFARELLSELAVEVQVSDADLEKIPAAGGVIAIANHPFRLLDGAMLGQLLARVRQDLRVLTTQMLGEMPELARICIFIDPFDRPACRTANSRALKHAVAQVKGGGLLLIFPASIATSRGRRDPRRRPPNLSGPAEYQRNGGGLPRTALIPDSSGREHKECCHAAAFLTPGIQTDGFRGGRGRPVRFNVAVP